MNFVEPDPPQQRRWTDGADRVEIALPRGHVTEGVVRAGATVRRPHQPTSYPIAHYLDHLERVGFDGSPRFLGVDDAGRDVLTFIDGAVSGASPEPWVADEALLVSVGELLTDLHRASEGFDQAQTLFPPSAGQGPGTLVSHLDVTPQNVVVRHGRAVALIDFDLTRRATRVDDVYNTATHWVPLADPLDVYPDWAGVDQPRRLRLLADACQLPRRQRAGLVQLGIRHADASWTRMKERAERDGGGWARMWAEGVGDRIRRRQRWLADNEQALTAALLADG
ncbi:MAG: phosphotransferase [Acidimicrobiales bacterium]